MKVNEIDPLTLPSVPLEMRSHLPSTSAIYFAIDSLGNIQYIGKAADLRQRWTQHHRYKQLLGINGVRIAWLQIDTPELLASVEAALIHWFDPPLNRWGEINRGKQSTNNKKTTVTVFASEEMKEDLKKLADSEQRSLSQMAAILIQQGLAKAKEQGKIG